MVSCVLRFWGLFGRDLFRWTLRCKNSFCTAIRSEMKGRKRLVRLYRYLEHLSNGFSSLRADFIVPKAQCCEACVCLSVAWNKDEIRTMLEDWHWEINGKKKLCIHIWPQRQNATESVSSNPSTCFLCHTYDAGEHVSSRTHFRVQQHRWWRSHSDWRGFEGTLSISAIALAPSGPILFHFRFNSLSLLSLFS